MSDKPQPPTVQVVKFDDQRQIAFGWPWIAERGGQLQEDTVGESIELEALEEAAYLYVLNKGISGINHEDKYDDEPVGRLVESVVVTPEKLEKWGLPRDAMPHGLWVGYKIFDREVFEKVKSGELGMFSIQGRAGRR